MSEHQAEIFAMFGSDLLRAEQARLQERMAELQQRHELIVKELARRAVQVTVEPPRCGWS